MNIIKLRSLDALKDLSLVGPKVFIGYSCRNRAFSYGFFQTVFSFVKEKNLKLWILLIDEPYAFNESAFYGRQAVSSGELSKARKIGDERERMVNRALYRSGLTISPLISRWPGVDPGIPHVGLLRDELETACDHSPKLRSTLLQEATKRLNLHGGTAPESFLKFQLHELPVLIWIYYGMGYLIDIYPGEAFLFFQLLERGVFRHELPMASALAQSKELQFVSVFPGAVKPGLLQTA